MIIIYKNQEEYDKADRSETWKADVVAIENNGEYNIIKSRYTRCLLGVGDYYLADLIRTTLNLNEKITEYVDNGALDLNLLSVDKRELYFH